MINGEKIMGQQHICRWIKQYNSFTGLNKKFQILIQFTRNCTCNHGEILYHIKTELKDAWTLKSLWSFCNNSHVNNTESKYLQQWKNLLSGFAWKWKEGMRIFPWLSYCRPSTTILCLFNCLFQTFYYLRSLELYPRYHRLGHRLKLNSSSVLITWLSYLVQRFSYCILVCFWSAQVK